MTASEGREQFAVLYVDDEESSLKYFRMAYEKDFPVLTANSVPKARDLLQAGSPAVAVLISDQRMPGESGTDLLSEVRQNRPEIIRILTTAYSDMESAIEAVNAGEVYRYVVKPWDSRGLRATLAHAMELFTLRRERDALLREKLSVRRKMVLSDRLRSLAALAATLEPALPGALAGFVASLRLLPEDALDAPEAPLAVSNLAAMAEQTRQEAVRSVRLVEQFAERVDWSKAAGLQEVSTSDLMSDAVRRAAQRGGDDAASVRSEPAAECPALNTSPHLCVEALSALLSFALAAGNGEPTVTASEADTGVAMCVSVAPGTATDALSLSTPQAPVLELLFASILAHNLRGSIEADMTAEGWKLALNLPLDAAAVPVESAGDEALARALDLEDLAF